MPIQILSGEVASQIAAGEVVERPASVVKELVENALDARATQITIRIKQGGRRLIEIADDGDGIPIDELTLSVERHATSKLRTAADLFSIHTLGFRGEALASIGSVSRMAITSCAQGAELGGRVRVDAGKIGELEKLGIPAGTVVRVEDLFYNVPARLKFLKTDATEKRHISALVTRYALAYTRVRFHLTQDGQVVLRTSGNGDHREVLASLYGVDIARQMLEIQLEEEGFRVSGFISPIDLTRSNRREITFFVNGRWVQDSALSSSLLQAYRTMLMVGRYPMAVLFLQLDPEEVDVNVHPAKAEVRFRKSDLVFARVHRAVKRGLLTYSPVAQPKTPNWGGGAYQSPSTPYTQRAIDPAWDMAADEDEDLPVGLPGQRSVETPGQPSLPASNLPLLRLIGQVGATYLVAEGPDGLYLIDQHAAHERVLFERMMKLRSEKIPSQALLEPEVFQLQPESAQLLADKLPFLGELGFEVELFGPNAFRVTAIPHLLTGSDPVSAVRVVVEDFEADETPLQHELEAKLVARICKRAAVKAGHVLSKEEQEALIQGLENCESPRTCPHGRPTMIHLSVDLLERQFGRRGAR